MRPDQLHAAALSPSTSRGCLQPWQQIPPDRAKRLGPFERRKGGTLVEAKKESKRPLSHKEFVDNWFWLVLLVFTPGIFLWGPRGLVTRHLNVQVVCIFSFWETPKCAISPLGVFSAFGRLQNVQFLLWETPNVQFLLWESPT